MVEDATEVARRPRAHAYPLLMVRDRRRLIEKVGLLLSGLLFVAYAVWHHASIDAALAIVAGSVVAFGVYLIAPSRRRP